MRIFRPGKGMKFHWHRKDGEPRCLGEYVTQFITAHRIMLYVATVTTLTLLFQVLNLRPLGGLFD